MSWKHLFEIYFTLLRGNNELNINNFLTKIWRDNWRFSIWHCKRTPLKAKIFANSIFHLDLVNTFKNLCYCNFAIRNRFWAFFPNKNLILWERFKYWLRRIALRGTKQVHQFIDIVKDRVILTITKYHSFTLFREHTYLICQSNHKIEEKLGKFSLDSHNEKKEKNNGIFVCIIQVGRQ